MIYNIVARVTRYTMRYKVVNTFDNPAPGRKLRASTDIAVPIADVAVPSADVATPNADVSASSADIVASNGECSSVSWCITMFLECFMMFHNVLRVFHDVSQCFKSFHDVLLAVHDVLRRFTMYKRVSWCFTMFYDVSWVAQRTGSPTAQPSNTAGILTTPQVSAITPQRSSISPRKWSHAKLRPEWRRVTLFLEDNFRRGTKHSDVSDAATRQHHEQTIHNWNKTRTNSFLEMGKSSSNVLNVFKGSSWSGNLVYRYWELHADIYYCPCIRSQSPSAWQWESNTKKRVYMICDKHALLSTQNKFKYNTWRSV